MGPGADTTIIAAFAVGFASFVSPCVLPLVPGYLSVISGLSVADLSDRRRPLGRVLWPSLVFCLSFTVIFVALGMTATGIGSTLQDHRRTLDVVAGSLVIALGVLFLLTPFVPALNRQWRPETLALRAAGGPLIAGVAFAVAWTPCVGFTLGSILTAASTADSVGRGGLLLACFSLGLAVPFLLTAVFFGWATRVFRWLRDRYLVVTAISGAILVAMGVLMVTGELTQLNVEAQRLVDSLGIDFFEDL